MAKPEPKLTRVAFQGAPASWSFLQRAGAAAESDRALGLRVANGDLQRALSTTRWTHCEEAEVAPEIAVTVDPGAIIIQDNAGGIDGETIEKSVLDYTIRVSSNEAVTSPTRGAQGNALKTPFRLPWVCVLDRRDGGDRAGVTTIEARGVLHRIEFRVDHISNQPKIVRTTAPSPVVVGTKFTLHLHWPQGWAARKRAAGQVKRLVLAYVWFNPHLTVRGTWFGQEFINEKATNPDWEKWRPRNPTSPHWYDQARLQRYLAAHVARDRDLGQRRTVREFIAEFRGLSGTAVQRKILTEVGCSHQSLAQFFGVDRGDPLFAPLVEGGEWSGVSTSRPLKKSLASGIGSCERLISARRAAG